MLALGACQAENPHESFYAELCPLPDADVQAEALAACNLDVERLKREGSPSDHAMSSFRRWTMEVAGANTPIFVGFNAPFDWAFVNYYFHLHDIENPFGFTALDIKALYMGHTGCTWGETRSSRMPPSLRPQPSSKHHALSDAKAQAHTFLRILES